MKMEELVRHHRHMEDIERRKDEREERKLALLQKAEERLDNKKRELLGKPRTRSYNTKFGLSQTTTS